MILEQMEVPGYGRVHPFAGALANLGTVRTVGGSASGAAAGRDETPGQH